MSYCATTELVYPCLSGFKLRGEVDNTYHLFVFSLDFYHISPLLKNNREFTVAFLGHRV